jgi:endogenous inhibitor of DNA gyrase (YacG/DUF329 family)
MELKPCPFCGSDVIPAPHNPYCKKCGLQINLGIWNSRPLEESLQATIVSKDERIAELEGLLCLPCDGAPKGINVCEARKREGKCSIDASLKSKRILLDE